MRGLSGAKRSGIGQRTRRLNWAVAAGRPQAAFTVSRARWRAQDLSQSLGAGASGFHGVGQANVGVRHPDADALATITAVLIWLAVGSDAAFSS